MLTASSNRLSQGSLKDHPCPYCGRGRLQLRNESAGVVNRCPKCKGEVVTESEWLTRQRETLTRKAVKS